MLDYQYALTKANCAKCYSHSTACIANDFRGGTCCPRDQFESLCKQGYTYCSNDLTSSKYQRLTCPTENCPDDPQWIYIDKVNDVKEESRRWDFFITAFNCRVIIKANNLNAKLNVEVLEIKGTELLGFEMPNNYDTSKVKSTGIV